MLPILHLNGYKIANPTVLARIGDDELTALLDGYGYRPYLVDGDDPATVHQLLAATLDAVFDEIAAIQRAARERRRHRPATLADDRAAHAEGLDRPEGGRRPAGRGHLAGAPGAAAAARDDAAHLAALRGVDALLPAGGALRRTTARPRPEVVDWLPTRRPADGRQPARQRRPAPRALELPDFRDYAVKVPSRARPAEPTRVLGGWLRDVMTANAAHRNFRLVGPDETESNRLGAVLEVTDKAWQADVDAGRPAPRPARPGDGDPVRAHLPGLAGGLPADRPARAVLLLRGVHPHRRLDGQPARQVAEGRPGSSPGAARSRR